MSTGAKKTTKKTKRKYNTDPKSKIETGKNWEYNCKFDDDVTKKIIDEKQKSGSEYGFIINNRMRKAYGIKK